MSSGWPIGASKTGLLIASKCGQWGIGVDITKINGVGSLSAALYYAITMHANTRFLYREDTPWGTIVTPTAAYAGADEAGVSFYSSTDVLRYRQFLLFNIPAGITITDAFLYLPSQFQQNLSAVNYYCNFYINPTCSNPPVAADWANVNTGTLFYQDLLAAGNSGYGVSLNIPITPSQLTPGAMNKISMGLDCELANTNPGVTVQSVFFINPNLFLRW